MNNPVFDLSDEALYQLLQVLAIKDIIALKVTQGDKRKRVFDDARLYHADRLALPLTFSLKEIDEYITASDYESKAEILINHGDYPQLVVTLVDNDIAPEVFDLALKKGRENTALALLHKVDVETAFIDAITNRNKKVLNVIMGQLDPLSVISSLVFSGETYIDEQSLIWLFKNFNIEVTAEFIDEYLSTYYVTPKMLRVLLSNASKEDIESAYQQHLESLDRGISVYGGDYLTDIDSGEITNVFTQFV